MYFKLCLLALCVYRVCCGLSPEAALTKCKAAYNLTSDEPLEYFGANGKLRPGDEHLKCFFNCYAKATGDVDKKGVPLPDKVENLNDRIRKACIPPPDVSTPCDATFSYLVCASSQQSANRPKAK